MSDFNIPAFVPGAAAAETDKKDLGTGFSLTTGSPPMPGIRRPDSIDTDDDDIQITTSTGVRALPPEQMAQLQQQLQRAGMLPSTFKGFGAMGPDTAAALRKLKETSRMTGLSDVDTLREVIDTNTRMEDPAVRRDVDQSAVRTTRSTSTPTLTDPVSARSTIRAQFEADLGRAPTAEDYEDYLARLRGEESGMEGSTTQTVYGRKGRAKSSNTTPLDPTTDPSAAAVADEFTRTGKLGRERNTRMAGTDYYASILSLPGMGS